MAKLILVPGHHRNEFIEVGRSRVASPAGNYVPVLGSRVGTGGEQFLERHLSILPAAWLSEHVVIAGRRIYATVRWTKPGSKTSGGSGTIPTMLEAVVIVLLTLILERAANVPRDIRRSDAHIRNRDEDLRTWIEDDDRHLKTEHLRILASESVKSAGPDLSILLYQQAKDQLVHRYRDQLRDAERARGEIVLSEQVLHRLARRILARPVPVLSAPSDMSEVLAHWHERPGDLLDRSLALREVAEQRRERAGKPRLRPLHPPRQAT